MSNKKFSIVAEGRTVATSNENEKFKVQGGTRPKVCPFCLTPDKIKRLEGQSEKTWKCKECGHEW